MCGTWGGVARVDPTRTKTGLCRLDSHPLATEAAAATATLPRRACTGINFVTRGFPDVPKLSATEPSAGSRRFTGTDALALCWALAAPNTSEALWHAWMSPPTRHARACAATMWDGMLVARAAEE